jgi:ABC-type spermidine/putrescine transport system permease subunit II
MFLVIYAGVLAFFLPFYVMGIYNQAKKINKNLETMMRLSADTLDQNSKSSGNRIC